MPGKMLVCTAALAGSLLALSTAASAATILSDPNINVQGQGFGNVHNILTLQDSPVETGEVAWDGVKDVYSGDADTNSNKSATFLISSITSDPTRLGIVFNLNDSGGDVEDATIESMIAKFYDTAGNVIVTATFTAAPKTFPQSGGGVGGDGNPFKFDFSPAELTLLSAPGVRIGLAATVSSVDAGADTFIVAQLPEAQTLSTVPVPASLWSGAGILAGLACARRYQRRNDRA
jgi:hypothetical protein